jgi:hypothetical protein
MGIAIAEKDCIVHHFQYYNGGAGIIQLRAFLEEL